MDGVGSSYDSPNVHRQDEIQVSQKAEFNKDPGGLFKQVILDLN